MGLSTNPQACRYRGQREDDKGSWCLVDTHSREFLFYNATLALCYSVQLTATRYGGQKIEQTNTCNHFISKNISSSPRHANEREATTLQDKLTSNCSLVWRNAFESRVKHTCPRRGLQHIPTGCRHRYRHMNSSLAPDSCQRLPA